MGVFDLYLLTLDPFQCAYIHLYFYVCILYFLFFSYCIIVTQWGGPDGIEA